MSIVIAVIIYMMHPRADRKFMPKHSFNNPHVLVVAGFSRNVSAHVKLRFAFSTHP